MVWIQPCKRCTPGLAGFFSKEPESKCLKLWELNSRRSKCSILSLCREDSHGLCKWFESRFRTEPGRGGDWAWAIAGDRSMGGQGTPRSMAGGWSTPEPAAQRSSTAPLGLLPGPPGQQ